MGKLIKIILTLLIFSFIGVASYSGFIFLSISDDDIDNIELSTQIEDEKTVRAAEKEEQKTVDKNLTEDEFLQVIHEMTHQKVRADSKQGFIEINDQNLEDLQEMLAENKKDFKNYDFLKETLDDWQASNFDNAVEVHNEIWKMQGGETGEAKRLLTEEEEQGIVSREFK